MATTFTHQDFAKNLLPASLGTAIYHPVELRDNCGRVGDVGFIDGFGTYHWICQAFDEEVTII